MKYEHIIWDWNGTLLNDAWLCVEVMNEILDERGMTKVGLETYRKWFDFPVKDYYAKLGFDFRIEAFEIVGTRFIEKYNERQYESELQPFAYEILKHFATLGIRQYVLSARQHDSLVENLEHYQLARFFDEVIGLDDHLAYGKEENGIHFMRKKGIPPEKLVFIGDTLHDLDVAMAMGVDCLLVSNGHHCPERLLKMSDKVYHDLQHLRQSFT